MTEKLTIIGRAEQADFPDLGLLNVPVKIDTGADSSSIWVKSAKEFDGELVVVFFDTENTVHFPRSQYSQAVVESSFGHQDVRYKVKLRIRIKGKLIRGTFTLSDRSQKTYPVLIGRRLLRQKFIVDVSQGKPLVAAEKAKSKRLQQSVSKKGDM